MRVGCRPAFLLVACGPWWRTGSSELRSFDHTASRRYSTLRTMGRGDRGLPGPTPRADLVLSFHRATAGAELRYWKGYRINLQFFSFRRAVDRIEIWPGLNPEWPPRCGNEPGEDSQTFPSARPGGNQRWVAGMNFHAGHGGGNEGAAPTRQRHSSSNFSEGNPRGMERPR